MSKTFKNLIISIVGLVTILTTICGFFIFGFNRAIVLNTAFGFLLFSEFLLFGGLLILRNINFSSDNLFLNVGITTTIFIYFLLTAVIFVFSDVFESKINFLIGFEIILFAILAVILAVIIFFGVHIKENNEKTTSQRSFLQLCEKKIYNLAIESKNSEYKNKLMKIYENIRYSDKIGSTLFDEKIVGAVMKLEEEINSESAVSDEVFEKINELILKRNMEIKEKKRGEI